MSKLRRGKEDVFAEVSLLYSKNVRGGFDADASISARREYESIFRTGSNEELRLASAAVKDAVVRAVDDSIANEKGYAARAPAHFFSRMRVVGTELERAAALTELLERLSKFANEANRTGSEQAAKNAVKAGSMLAFLGDREAVPEMEKAAKLLAAAKRFPVYALELDALAEEVGKGHIDENVRAGIREKNDALMRLLDSLKP